jgi:hypothetical protein
LLLFLLLVEKKMFWPVDMAWKVTEIGKTNWGGSIFSIYQYK